MSVAVVGHNFAAVAAAVDGLAVVAWPVVPVVALVVVGDLRVESLI